MKLLEVYRNLDPRDRNALLALSVFLSTATLIWAIILPSYRLYSESKQGYLDSVELINWISANESKINTQSNLQPEKDRNILPILSASAQSFDIEISRFQPQDNKRVNLWLSNVKYTKMLKWLDKIVAEDNIFISAITIDRSNNIGFVNVQLTLQ